MTGKRGTSCQTHRRLSDKQQIDGKLFEVTRFRGLCGLGGWGGCGVGGLVGLGVGLGLVGILLTLGQGPGIYLGLYYYKLPLKTYKIEEGKHRSI